MSENAVVEGAHGENEPDPFVGRTLANKYRIDKFVGGGAMGKVYKATQLLLDKVVAIKVLHAALGLDPQFKARFQREAKAASRIEHPNSVQILDFGIEGDGLMYIAMEFLPGRDLHKAIYDDWPLPLDRVVEIMSQTLSALAIAHDQGIVHRDLKPENIMLVRRPGDDGRSVEQVKVADFGIAKLVESSNASAGPKLTQQGLVSGTPDYMSPEQAQAKDLDGRSDLYACGVILFQMCTGRLPFEGETAIALVLKHITEPPPNPLSLNPSLHPGLADVVLRALAKNPDDRYANAREMRAALRALVSSSEGAGASRESLVANAPSESAAIAGGSAGVTAPRDGGTLPTIAAMPTHASLSAGTAPPATTPPATSVSSLNVEVAPAGASARTSPIKLAAGALIVAALSGVVAIAATRRTDPSPDTNPARGVSVQSVVAATGSPTTSVAPSALPTAAMSAAASVLASAPSAAASAHPSSDDTNAPNLPQRGARARHGDHTGNLTSASAPPADTASAAPTGLAAPRASVEPSAPPAAPSAAAAPPPTATAALAPSASAAAPSAPTVPPLRAVSASLGSLSATGGITSRQLQPRAASAASALGQCVEREARAHNGGASFTNDVNATVRVEVRDRRVDAVHVSGGPAWVASCSSALRSAFAGDLPASDDNEYEITFSVALSPER